MPGKKDKDNNEVTQLRQALRQREAELAILNRVQMGFVSQLDFQAIVDMVGDKIREVFDAQGLQIVTFDMRYNLIIRHYVLEKGQRLHVGPVPISILWQRFIENGETSNLGNLPELLRRIDPGFQPPAGELPVSSLTVPLWHEGKIHGAINLFSIDQENAFSQADARLLETLSGAMSLAIENARLLDETRQRSEELQILNSVQQGLAERLKVQDIFDLVGDKIRDIFNAQVVMISPYDPQTNTVEHRYAIERGERVYSPGSHPPGGFRARIIQTGQPLLVNSNVAQQAAKFGQPTLPGTITPKSWLGVPMLVNGKVTGILSLQNVDQENAFIESDVRLLQTFAASMSVALENARLWEQEELYRKALEHEFEIGRNIQESFLPETLPQPPGWELAARLKMAREVAGDFYDAFELPDGKIGLVIADVCDKGLGAALFMTLFRSLLRAVSSIDFFEHERAGETAPAARLKNAISLTNDYIAETHSKTGMFATIFFGILDADTGVLTYINGGHLPPMLINHSGLVRTLALTGPAVGALLNAEYTVQEIRLEPGDLLFAYTDGLTDTTNPSGEYFSQHAVIPMLVGAQNLSTVLKMIRAQVEHFAEGAKQFDDITMLALRRKSQ